MKLVFDVEKLRTECHVFARHISNIIYIVQVSKSTAETEMQYPTLLPSYLLHWLSTICIRLVWDYSS